VSRRHAYACAGRAVRRFGAARFNGNEFVGTAFSTGAAGALVDTEQPMALRRSSSRTRRRRSSAAARSWREAFDIPLVGVAGSNGKTTAKEMNATILGQAGSCLPPGAILNNHIGVPLTLLRSSQRTALAVVEIGCQPRGRREQLVRIGASTIGVITNRVRSTSRDSAALEVWRARKARLSKVSRPMRRR